MSYDIIVLPVHLPRWIKKELDFIGKELEHKNLSETINFIYINYKALSFMYYLDMNEKELRNIKSRCNKMRRLLNSKDTRIRYNYYVKNFGNDLLNIIEPILKLLGEI